MTVSLGQIAAAFLSLSLGAIGGANATLPELHRQMVTVLHLMDDQTFASLVALAQAAPGPNVIVMSLMGWHVAGPSGLAVATLSMIGPSSALAFASERALRRYSASGAVAILKKSLAPIAVGLMGASGLVLARAADRGVLTLALTGGMSLLCGLTRVNPLYGIAGGACAGLAGALFGFPL
ncbi:chromate transporter [Methylocella silvestris]|uniref:Chromate transporter n=1 Tax=Methylocella silvestris TaxID=199596 RepID=A0A2J7TDM8_METSI|nr:chromate transporter [Methylocella silvestris]PNG24871.1 chromate transporter [Methylocella silvestris]